MLFAPFFYQTAGGIEVVNALRFKGTQYFSGANLGIDTYTTSCWVKRSLYNDYNMVWSSNQVYAGWTPASTYAEAFRYYNGATAYESLGSYRDPTAWYHVVVRQDGIGTDTNTVFINGEPVVTGNGVALNSASPFEIGRWYNNKYYLHGYMADFYMVSNQALQPDEFGEYNSDGVWIPKKYTGTYGTEGFHLTFDPLQNADPMVGIGVDSSGNGNNFTAYNFDVIKPSIRYKFENPDGVLITSYPTANLGQGAPFAETSNYTYAPKNVKTNITWTFVDPIVATSSIGVFWQGVSQYAGNVLTIFYDDGSSDVVDWDNPANSNNVASLTSVRETGGVITSVNLSNEDGASAYCGAWAGFEIDGAKLFTADASTYDLVSDTPTENWMVLNQVGSAATANFLDGNLTSYSGNSLFTTVTMPARPGQKLYCESTQQNYLVGFIPQDNFGGSGYVGKNSNHGVGFDRTGKIYDNNVVQTETCTPFVATDTVMMAYDVDAGLIWQGVNGYWHNDGDPATGANPTFDLANANTPYDLWQFAFTQNGTKAPINFAQQTGFTYEPPEGYTTLSTSLLGKMPIPTGRDHCRTIVGSGTGPDPSAPDPGQRVANWTPFLFTATASGESYKTLAKNFSASYPVNLAFNGDTSATSATNTATGTTTVSNFLVFYPETPITVNTSLRVFTRNYGGAAHYSINGADKVAMPAIGNGGNNTYGWADLSFTGELTQFGIQDKTNSNTYLQAIEIDGEILVSNGILSQAQTEFPRGMWLTKSTSATDNWQFVDSVRGGDLAITSNGNGDQQTAYVDPPGNAAAWCWSLDTDATANSNGTISSQVATNKKAGFSVVTYTGNGVAGATVGHGLDEAPEVIMVKCIEGPDTSALGWRVYSKALTASSALALNTSAAQLNGSQYWNDTDPTNQVFSIGTDNQVNLDGQTYVAYCWHSVPGYSKMGTYQGNGSANGAFINCGFRPASLWTKRTNATQNWYLMDSTRSPANPVGFYISQNTTAKEATTTLFDFVANGIKMRATSAAVNAAAPYFFMAFAAHPYGGSNVSPATAH